MKVKLVNLPVDRYAADVLLVYCFSGERPLRGETGLIDWWLEGNLSRSILSGRIRGELHEQLLSSSARRIAADRVLLTGLGPREEFSLNVYRELAGRLGTVVVKMGLNSVATVLPGFHDSRGRPPGIPSSQAAEILVEAIARAMPREGYAREPELIVAVDGEMQDEVFLGAQQVKVNLKGMVDLEIRVGE